MKQPAITCSSEMYIEADSTLSAMKTFLIELRTDPAARSLLATMVDELAMIVDSGLDHVEMGSLNAGRLRGDIENLRRAIEMLPTNSVADDASWQQLRSRHRDCRRSFSELMDILFDGANRGQSSYYTAIGRRFEATA